MQSLSLVITQLNELDVTDQAGLRPTKVISGLLGTLLRSENSSHGRQKRESEQGKGEGKGIGVGKRETTRTHSGREKGVGAEKKASQIMF